MNRKMLATAMLGLSMSVISAASAFAATAAQGYAVSDFATGFPNDGNAFGVGPIGLAFDATDHLFVMDYHNGFLYKFGTSGGAAGTLTRVNTVPIIGNPAGIAFSKDGHLYLALQDVAPAGGKVVEVNPQTGVITRVVSDQTPGATGIATDPLSGNLFVTLPFIGKLVELTNFSDFTGQTKATVTNYATLEIPDGITFAADGTIYVADEGWAKKIVGTNSTASHTPTNIAQVPTIDGIALAAGSGSTPSAIFGNTNNGNITKIDLTGATPQTSNIVTNGTRGDFTAVGPDGCLYATQTATVIKVTNADGTCSFATTVSVPVLRLTPASQTAHVGSSVTITATLTNASSKAGDVVTFTVTGANAKVGTATTNASGIATFTYSGTLVGSDSISATTTANDQAVSSNTVAVTWTAAPTPTPTPVAALPQTGSPSSGWIFILLAGLLIMLGGVMLTSQRRT